MKLVRAGIVLALSGFYFSRVFSLSTGELLTTGLGDWINPYFINYVLEHWRHSLLTFTDPSSPPMFFPAPGMLGYSHSLVLYEPFYLVARLFAGPLQSHALTLLIVMEVGTLCLYAVLRRFVRLGFVEALIVTACFVTSVNVINIGTSIWAHLASVFLVPPILLICLRSWQADGRRQLAGLAVGGLLYTLVPAQDIYTGMFMFLFTVVLAAGGLWLPSAERWDRRLAGWWRAYRPRILAFGAGAGVGVLVFLWIYLDAYRVHQEFPRQQVLEALRKHEPSSWHSVRDVFDALKGYESMRAFAVVFILGTIAWLPGVKTSAAVRRYSAWFMLVSFVVVLIPLRIHKWSLWVDVFYSLPGFSAVRDPKRIIYMYELAFALVLGVFLAQLPARSMLRIAAAGFVLYLVGSQWKQERFEFKRPQAVYDQWVKSPIQIDSSCRSFFIKGASEVYMSRSGHMWSLYNIDSMFIALDHNLPTLNGYSAWGPTGWDLANPQSPPYMAAVDSWIRTHRLQQVCAFDIERRTMTPYTPPAAR